jgi:hypothetical protein
MKSFIKDEDFDTAMQDAGNILARVLTNDEAEFIEDVEDFGYNSNEVEDYAQDLVGNLNSKISPIENKITTQSRLNEALPSEMIKDYWSIMVENQPEDVINILVGLTNGDLSFEKFSLDTANDVYDSFKDEMPDDDEDEF